MTEIKYVTYLLGAGASYNCLPIINELPNRFERFRNILRSPVGRASEIAQKSKLLSEEYEWLLHEMSKHKTIDTLARKYYLLSTKHDDLLKLKRLLIIYFLFEQTFPDSSFRKKEIYTPALQHKNLKKEIPDKRYDTFIASIIDTKINSLKLPSQLKIITWNYDLQFELSYKEYLPGLNINEIQEKIQAIPSRKYILDQLTIDTKQFLLIRLNGVAGIGKYHNENIFLDEPFHEFNSLKSLVRYNDLLKEGTEEEQNNLLTFNFSWEDPQDEFKHLSKKSDSIKNIAYQVMQETNILVVIGYSFPYFNRNIDKDLFIQANKLEKVYVQDPNAKDIIGLMQSSFKIFKTGSISVRNIEIEPVFFTDQFLIPTEF